jgi:hypothetical protein
LPLGDCSPKMLISMHFENKFCLTHRQPRLLSQVPLA